MYVRTYIHMYVHTYVRTNICMYLVTYVRTYIRMYVCTYSGTCLRWSLCKAATSLKQPASLAPDTTTALESISVEQPPLYNGQLEHMVRTGPQAVVLVRFHCVLL